MRISSLKSMRISLRLQLTFIFGGLVLITVLTMTFVNFYLFRSHLSEIAEYSLEEAGSNAVLKVQNLLSPPRHILHYISGFGFYHQTQNKSFDFETLTRLFYSSLGVIPYETPQIYGVYIGFPDGAFIDLERGDREFRKAANIPESNDHPFVRWYIIPTKNDLKDIVYYFEGTDWMLSESADFKYDPRTRPWYKSAMDANQPVWTDVYKYAMADILGITLSAKIPGEKQGEVFAVIGIDILLNDLSQYLDSLKFSPNGFAFIAKNDGKLIAHSALLDKTVLKQSVEINLQNYHYVSAYDLKVFSAFSTSDRKLLRIDSGNEQLIAMRISLSDAAGLDAALYIGAPVTDFTKFSIHTVYINFAISLVIGMMMVIVSFKVSKGVARPINKTVLLLDRIRNFDFSIRPDSAASRILEIHQMKHAAVLMHDALQSFLKFVPADLVKNLVRMGQPLELGGKRMEVTILFTDIADFTTISEETDENELVLAMAAYLKLMSNIISKHQGTVDKFIGDSVMAIWGAPKSDPEHAKHGCEAVIECLKALEAQNALWKTMKKPVFETRFGLHCGLAFVGNIGSPDRLNYTALGDAVNIAARLESLNKEKGTKALVSSEIVKKCHNDFNFKDLGNAKVKGKQNDVHIFELCPGEFCSGNRGEK
jgi:adenylate cyclase